MPKKILVVEDDKFSYKLYDHLLTEAGYKVISTPIATEAAKLTKEHKPDLIIMDIMLKDGNGFDATREIRQDPKSKNTPIIAISNLGQKSDIQEAIDNGSKKKKSPNKNKKKPRKKIK